jgi:hypothetical protein
MLSKCANPDCAEQFLYLHQGKLFYVHTVPDLRDLVQKSCEHPGERYWLCDACSQKFTMIWDGLHARLVKLRSNAPLQENASDKEKKEELARAKTRGAGE